MYMDYFVIAVTICVSINYVTMCSPLHNSILVTGRYYLAGSNLEPCHNNCIYLVTN